MYASMFVVFGEWVRKALALGAGALLATTINNGLLTQGQVDQWVTATAAIIVALITALWSRVIFPWIQKVFTKKVTTA